MCSNVNEKLNALMLNMRFFGWISSYWNILPKINWQIFQHTFNKLLRGIMNNFSRFQHEYFKVIKGMGGSLNVWVVYQIYYTHFLFIHYIKIYSEIEKNNSMEFCKLNSIVWTRTLWTCLIETKIMNSKKEANWENSVKSIKVL